MNIYLYSSKNLLIERNIIKVTNQNYNSKYGKAVGIGLSSDSENDIENIEIQNNIIVGCRIGIYFFITGTGTYKSVKIYHNTIWMVDITPIWFAEPINNPSNSELYNNLIYHNKQSQLYPKSVWGIGYNFFYNSDKVPTQYSDSGNDKGTSRATKNMELSKIAVIICALYFLSLLCEFFELGGTNFKLLKLLMQMCLILFFLVIWKYKDELLSDKYQRKIEQYFYKKTKN